MKLSLRNWTLLDRAALGAVGLGTWFALRPPPNQLTIWWESQALHFMLLLLTGGLLCFFINRIRLTFIAFAGCALLAYVFHERSRPPHQEVPIASARAFDLRVGIFQPPAADLDRFLHTISETDAHVLALQNVSHSQLPRIDQHLEHLGYSRFPSEPDRQQPLAHAVYARPPVSLEPLPGSDDFYTLTGRLHLGDLTDSIRELRFLYLPRLPGTGAMGSTNTALRRLAGRLLRENIPLLAMGDLQFVPWSRDLQRFKQHASLFDSHTPFHSSSRMGDLSLLAPAKRQLLYSNHFKCISFETISGNADQLLGVFGIYRLFIRPNRSTT